MLGITEENLKVETLIEENSCFLNYLEMKSLNA